MFRNIRKGLKYSVYGVGAVYLSARAVEHFEDSDKQFASKIKLVFPDYDNKKDEKYGNSDKVVKCISKQQIQYAIRQCNTFNKKLTFLQDTTNLGNSSDLILDLSEMNQESEISGYTNKKVFQPGVSLNEKEKTQLFPSGRKECQEFVDQAVFENKLMLNPITELTFSNKVERVGLVTGSGEFVQTGGNKVGGQFQFGLDLTKLVVGSRGNLGCLYEVIVDQNSETWQSYGYYNEEQSTLKDAMTWLQELETKELDGAVILGNKDSGASQISYGRQMRGSPHFYSSQRSLSKHLQTIVQADHDDSWVKLVVPRGKTIKTFGEFTSFIEKKSYQIHCLGHDQVYVYLPFNSTCQEDLLQLDKLTSTVIKRGGTIEPSSRRAMDLISPYLAKRILGEFNLPIQEHIKRQFDPNNVMAGGDGSMFNQDAQAQKSIIQRAREHNKQVQFYFTKFGL